VARPGKYLSAKTKTTSHNLNHRKSSFPRANIVASAGLWRASLCFIELMIHPKQHVFKTLADAEACLRIDKDQRKAFHA